MEMGSNLKRLIKANPLAYEIASRVRNIIAALPYLRQLFMLPVRTPCLIVGSNSKIPGWTTFDICPGADYLGNITNLRLFASSAVGKVYASHVLEHVTYQEASVVLAEMHRILQPQGELFLVVPDLINLNQLLRTEQAEVAVDIIYGINKQAGLGNPGHKYGYTREMLSNLLQQVGFTHVEEFEPFLADTSNYHVSGVKVSLCLKSIKSS